MSIDTHKRDFSSNARLPGICALAAAIGMLGMVAAYALLNLIHLFTNLFFYGAFSFADRSPADNTLGPWVVLVPAAGGLIVGLIARFGSEKFVAMVFPRPSKPSCSARAACRRRSRY